MWNRNQSIILSWVATRVIMALGLLLAIALPLFGHGIIRPENVSFLLPIYYSFCVPAYVALIALDRLLAAIKRDEVFTVRNVRYLRIISWACFAVAFILFTSSVIALWGTSGVIPASLFTLAVLATFFGIIMRVVKNLFAAAVDIKTENDFTI